MPQMEESRKAFLFLLVPLRYEYTKASGALLRLLEKKKSCAESTPAGEQSFLP